MSAPTTCAPLAGTSIRTSATCARRWASCGSAARACSTCTIPLDLGRPRAGAGVEQANAAIERVAGELGALVVDLRDFGARNRVMADAVHPTAFGQIAIAERALDVLGGDGMQVRVRPHALIAFDATRWGRLRGDATYVYRQAKQAARIGLASVVARDRQLRQRDRCGVWAEGPNVRECRP